MRVDLLDYDLPPDRIAQTPTPERDGARMLVVDPEGADAAALQDRTITDLPEVLPAGALLVVNDTRVIHARLIARKPETGGKVEIFLVRPEEPKTGDEPRGEPPYTEIWRALGKASKPLRFGQDLEVGEDLHVNILGRAEDDGLLRVRLTSRRNVGDAVATHGQVPLPPYIKRGVEAADAERYQTVFARNAGAVAAPTAGLHLSNALLGRLTVAGFELTTVTLHVGLGTFQPVSVDDFDAHPMHREEYEVTRAAAGAINKARREGRTVVAVGTTAVRAVESAARHAIDIGASDPVVPVRTSTNLLLQPGAPMHVVGALLTNFHLPRSTLLALVATLIGAKNLHAAYRHAIDHGYRFYSYGDAMLIRGVLPPEVARGAI